MNKAIFLDRDGTINVEKNYLYKVEDFEFLPRVIDGLKLLQEAGFLLVIITNQSGIGRGYYKEEDFKKLNDWMINTLKEHGVNIAHVYYCPHLPNASINDYRLDCDCRKPKLGMFLQAVNDYNLEFGNCYAIGDKLRDCEVCKSTDCQGFLIGNNEKAEVISDVKAHLVKNVEYCNDLYDCAVRIISYKTET